jgi:hypothetical protein
MICHLLLYWVIGLPLGYVLCYKLGWGAVGLWAGLCLALIAWIRKVGSMTSRLNCGRLFLEKLFDSTPAIFRHAC